MSPTELHVLLWIYARPAPPLEMVPTVIASASAVADLVTSLHRRGLVQRNATGDWVVTAKGDTYVGALLKFPLPEQRWVVP